MERSVDIFRCDRCRETVEMERGKQPSRWRRLRTYNPVRSSEVEVGGTFDLCDGCWAELKRWLAEPPPQAATDRQVA